MPFTLRPFRRFLMQCSVTYNAGPFLKLLTYFLGFGMLLTLLVSSGPACTEIERCDDDQAFLVVEHQEDPEPAVPR